jgi:hypothetical protein
MAALCMTIFLFFNQSAVGARGSGGSFQFLGILSLLKVDGVTTIIGAFFVACNRHRRIRD